MYIAAAGTSTARLAPSITPGAVSAKWWAVEARTPTTAKYAAVQLAINELAEADTEAMRVPNTPCGDSKNRRRESDSSLREGEKSRSPPQSISVDTL
jgi:hypothetical protein